MPNSLQERQTALQARIQAIKAEINKLAGETYQGCWIDSATNATGKRYFRLRWFKSLRPKRKGCRILKGEDLAIATQAIDLWQQLEKAESELAEVIDAIGRIYTIADRYGLKILSD